MALCAERGGRRVSDQDFYKNFKSPCGTAHQVSKRLGGCLVEIFDLIEGRSGDPKDDKDLIGHCNRFNNTERCTRAVAKECLSGLHKTATGAVASGTRRFRLQECKNEVSRAKYKEPLKCAIRQGAEMKELFAKHTGILQGIRDLDIAPEEKLMKMCCVLNRLDVEVAKVFDKDCPQSTPAVIGIIHAMTDDARSTLCVAPKCNGALNQVLDHKYTPPQNFIEPIGQILYQISVN